MRKKSLRVGSSSSKVLSILQDYLQGWELIEEVILDFESQMKEAVNEEHEGKRKCELTWKVHRIHWEKNRFIHDLMYKRKVMSRELVSSIKSP